jgi:hypothetical protein
VTEKKRFKHWGLVLMFKHFFSVSSLVLCLNLVFLSCNIFMVRQNLRSRPKNIIVKHLIVGFPANMLVEKKFRETNQLILLLRQRLFKMFLTLTTPGTTLVVWRMWRKNSKSLSSTRWSTQRSSSSSGCSHHVVSSSMDHPVAVSCSLYWIFGHLELRVQNFLLWFLGPLTGQFHGIHTKGQG